MKVRKKDKKQEVINFIVKNNRLPSIKGSKKERILAIAMHSFCSKKGRYFDDDLLNFVKQYGYNKRSQYGTKKETMGRLLKFISENKRVPSRTLKGENGLRSALDNLTNNKTHPWYDNKIRDRIKKLDPYFGFKGVSLNYRVLLNTAKIYPKKATKAFPIKDPKLLRKLNLPCYYQNLEKESSI